MTIVNVLNQISSVLFIGGITALWLMSIRVRKQNAEFKKRFIKVSRPVRKILLGALVMLILTEISKALVMTPNLVIIIITRLSLMGITLVLMLVSQLLRKKEKVHRLTSGLNVLTISLWYIILYLGLIQ